MKRKDRGASRENEDTCAACGDGGALVCCDGCPRSFHAHCARAERAAADPSSAGDEWRCPACCVAALPRQLVADPSAPRAFFAEHGYVYLRRRVDASLCASLCARIEADFANMANPQQEEPSEFFSEETRAAMRGVQRRVVEEVLRRDLDARAEVPAAWGQTLYGRRKSSDCMTPWHCDALNTIVENRLLSHVAGGQPAALGRGAAPMRAEELPILTFWLCLRSLASRAQSHLRIDAGSHALRGIRIVRHAATGAALRVAPPGYAPKARAFLSPARPYEAGDVVVFHCLTQHDATPQKRPRRTKRAADAPSAYQDRISLDGRVHVPGLFAAAAGGRTAGGGDGGGGGRAVAATAPSADEPARKRSAK